MSHVSPPTSCSQRINTKRRAWRTLGTSAAALQRYNAEPLGTASDCVQWQCCWLDSNHGDSPIISTDWLKDWAIFSLGFSDCSWAAVKRRSTSTTLSSPTLQQINYGDSMSILSTRIQSPTDSDQSLLINWTNWLTVDLWSVLKGFRPWLVWRMESTTTKMSPSSQNGQEVSDTPDTTVCLDLPLFHLAIQPSPFFFVPLNTECLSVHRFQPCI